MKFPKSSTYDREYEVLKKAQEYLEAKKLPEGDLWQEYKLLANEYKRLLRISVKIMGISDKYHKKLMTAYEDLEKQNMILEEAAILHEDIERITRHDLKTPLNGIIGFSSLLLDNNNEFDKEQREMLSDIKESGYQMLEMINRSHDLYKMENGKYRYQAETVEIIKLFKKIASEHQSTITSKKLTVTIRLHDRLVTEQDIFPVQGEYLLCYFMFANLFKNAIEASPNELPITILLDRKNIAIITIHNQGAIPEEIRDRFFEKYVTAGKINGTGLGTYSAKLMSETQGGQIYFDTSSVTGTAITVQLLY